MPLRKKARISDREVRHSADSRSPSEELRQPGKRGLTALIPIAISLLVTVNTLGNGFASDDQQQVLNSPFIRDLRNIPAAFTSSVWASVSTDIVFTADSYFRPLFNVLFILNYGLFGTRAWGWHLVSVLINAGVVELTFLLLNQLTGRTSLAVVATSLFAAHPVHAESVAWVSGVPDPLIALFLIPAFYFYLRYRDGAGKYFLSLGLALFFLALLSKETAMAFPLLIFLTELFYFEDAGTMRQRLVAGAGRAGLFALPAAIYFLMRYEAIGHLLFTSEPRFPLGPALMSLPLALTKYLTLMIWPFGYSYQHYTGLVQTIVENRFVAPLVLVIAIVAVLMFMKSRLLWLAAIWFGGFLAPALAGLRQFDPEYAVQERYLYLPSIGFCLALALALQWLVQLPPFLKRERIATIASTVALVTFLGTVHLLQNRVWYNTITVFRRCVATAPGAATAHSSLARVLADAGHLAEATVEAQRALEYDPILPASYLTLSYVDFQSRKLDEAITDLERGLVVIQPEPMNRAGVATMQLNLGFLYVKRNNMDQAEQKFRQTIETLPRPAAWYYAGQFYQERTRYEEAREMFEKVRDSLPNYAPIHLRLGRIYELLGQPANARASYQEFLRLAPRNSPDRERIRQHLQGL